MTRIVHVNGALLPEDQATVSVFDRGFLMADGVYEVVSVLGGKLLDFQGHMTRLARSLGELGIANPHDEATWLELHRQLVAENALEDGMVYLQVTRGNPGDRDFAEGFLCLAAEAGGPPLRGGSRPQRWEAMKPAAAAADDLETGHGQKSI